jgi:hypothetical protein
MEMVQQQHAITRMVRLSRRAALRIGALTGVIGAGLAVGSGGSILSTPRPANAQAGAWRQEKLEVDFTPVDPISIVRAGSGPPQRGDWFYIDAPIYPMEQIGTTQIGTYQCFGAWTRAGTETDAPDQRLTSVQLRFEDGAIMGLINEAGKDPSAHVGAVQGGTGRFAGALGTFRQITLTGVISGVTPGQSVVRASLDLMLPNPGM